MWLFSTKNSSRHKQPWIYLERIITILQEQLYNANVKVDKLLFAMVILRLETI